jgi:uncharacterized protein YqeY
MIPHAKQQTVVKFPTEKTSSIHKSNALLNRRDEMEKQGKEQGREDEVLAILFSGKTRREQMVTRIYEKEERKEILNTERNETTTEIESLNLLFLIRVSIPSSEIKHIF